MADMQRIGALLGPLGQPLRESVTIRLPGDLKLSRLGVTSTASHQILNRRSGYID